MKAIQIKFMGATDREPSRLKAWTEGGKLVCSIDYSKEIGEQARLMADLYIEHMKWEGVVVSGFGVLPNGDYVATLR